jgi:hypothetical protein
MASFYSKAEKRFGGKYIAQDSAESGFRKIGYRGTLRINDRRSLVFPRKASKRILGGYLVVSRNTVGDNQEDAKKRTYIPSVHLWRNVIKAIRTVKSKFPKTSSPCSKSYNPHGVPKYRHQ